LWPIGEGEVGGDQQRHVLVELADQVKQQLSAGLAEREIAEFVGYIAWKGVAALDFYPGGLFDLSH
jgi:hypothetical protein